MNSANHLKHHAYFSLKHEVGIYFAVTEPVSAVKIKKEGKRGLVLKAAG